MRRLLSLFFVILSLLSFVACDEEMLQALRDYQQGKITQEQFNAAVQAYTKRNIYQQTPREDVAKQPTDPAADEYGCAQLIDTAPRGLACLQCNHPNAHYQADVIADIMLHSCLKNLAINYLVDGTFDYDETFMRYHLDKLAVGGRQVFANFYLFNGPAQRRYASTPVTALAAKISPEEFRKRLLSDAAFQNEVVAHVRRYEPLFRYAAQKGISVSVVPMLEDNLSDESFQALLQLVMQGLPGDVSFAIGRNPCPTCYNGNEKTVTPPLFTELHTRLPDFSINNALITNDGYDPANVSEMRPVRAQAETLGDMFILWGAARQGLWDGATVNTNPDERFYVVPSAAERKALTEFLRGN